MASIGLYTLTGHSQHGLSEVIRAGREIPDHVNELSPSNVTAPPDNTQIMSSRIFEGTREWLVSTLISFLGVLASAVLMKVKDLVSFLLIRNSKIFYRQFNIFTLAEHLC